MFRFLMIVSLWACTMPCQACGTKKIPDPEITEVEVTDGKVVRQYRNRLGYVLEEYESGTVKVKRAAALEKVLGKETYCSIPNLTERYVYHPVKIQNGDYENCSSSRVVYKKALHTGKELALDVELPETSDGPTPFIVWIHGGGWHGGSPDGMKWESKFFASQGIAGFRVQYQLRDRKGGAGALTNEEQLQDIADAVRYIKDHADEFNVDPENYYFIGGSAGGQLAILSGARDHGCSGIVPLYAVYDIRGFYDFLAEIGQEKIKPELARFWHMEDEAAYEATNPCSIVRAGMPPMLLFHGTGDSTAPYIFCEAFMKKMDECGNEYEIMAYPCYDHNFTGRGASDVYEEVQFKILDFIRRH